MIRTRIGLVVAALVSCSTASLVAQQADTVRVGSAALQGARLRVGTEAIESFRRVSGMEVKTSSTTQSVSLEPYGDTEVYVIHTIHVSAESDTTVGSIVIRSTDFSLLHHRVKATQDSAAVTASGSYLTGWVVLPEEPIRLIDQRLDHPVFPIEGQMPWLFPLLPLGEGYAAAIPHFSQWQGGEDWMTIRVTGSDLVEHEGEMLDCWEVDAGELFPQFYVTFWVDKVTRRILQSAVRGSEGGPEFWSVARPAATSDSPR